MDTPYRLKDPAIEGFSEKGFLKYVAAGVHGNKFESQHLAVTAN